MSQVLWSISAEVNVTAGGRRGKRRGHTPQLLLGPSGVSYKTARLLKSINGQRYIIHYTRSWFTAQPPLSFGRFSHWGRFPLVISAYFFHVSRQNLRSSQVGDNQTDTSNKALVTMAKFPEKDSLNMLVHKQGEGRRCRQACDFTPDRDSVASRRLSFCLYSAKCGD